MKSIRFILLLASASIFSVSGLGVSLANIGIHQMPVAQAATVDIAGLQSLLFGSVPSTVTASYRARNCQIWARFYWDCRHPAIDIAGPNNTPIYSPINGVVTRTAPNVGGVWIYNEKINISFLFLHMNSVTVAVDNSVVKGQQVGTQGTKGEVTGSHLHFETVSGKQTGFASDIRQTLNPLNAVNQTNSTNNLAVQYQAHVQNIGWQNPVADGQLAGTTGQGLQMEALKIGLTNSPSGAGICYQAHVQNIGWLNEVCNNQVAGTTGQGLGMEAIKIRLINPPGGRRVCYQAHVQNIGWQNEVCDNQVTGTTGQNLRMEALQIRIK